METETTGSELEERTITFAVTVIGLLSPRPRSDAAGVIGRRLLRSATFVRANYREANCAEPKADFVHKSSLARPEAAETDSGRQLCLRANLGRMATVNELAVEARDLPAILTTINRKAKGR